MSAQIPTGSTVPTGAASTGDRDEGQDAPPAALRRTVRRYAHELYPNPAAGQVRSLQVEVPYRYARAVGFALDGTGWEVMDRSVVSERTGRFVEAARVALLADALAQGMAGDEAWRWAFEHLDDDGAEFARERAVHYGVPIDQIKPFRCGPEPTWHTHVGVASAGEVRGRESECPLCTEPVDDGGA